MTDQRPETLEELTEAYLDRRLYAPPGKGYKGGKVTYLTLEAAYEGFKAGTYTIKTKPVTPIDLSGLVDGIDCEFWDLEPELIGWRGSLTGVDSARRLKPRYLDDNGDSWKYCRPRLNHIHAHQGGECPLPEGVKVRVKYWNRFADSVTGGTTDPSHIKWKHVAQYEVLGLMPNWRWPWERE